MTYAILSDIHGNLEALTRALEEAEKRKYDELIVLGDLIGYGPDPNECVELCRQHASVILLGNHDKAALHPEEAEYFNQYAARAVSWTSGRLTDENRTFLAALPLMERRERILFVHASPYLPEEWHYITSRYDADLGFSSCSEEFCFVGHSHIPVIFGTDSVVIPGEDPVLLTSGDRYIINVGSVGQPRDRDPRLSFGIFDDTENLYQCVRAEYNRDETARKILSANLPSFLANRLFGGE